MAGDYSPEKHTCFVSVTESEYGKRIGDTVHLNKSCPHLEKAGSFERIGAGTAVQEKLDSVDERLPVCSFCQNWGPR